MSQIAAKEHELKTGDKVVIRTAAADDAAGLLEHARIILEEDLYNVTTLDELKMTVEEERQWTEQHLENPGQIILVAELEDVLVGVLHFDNGSHRRLAHRGTLHMSVHPNHRRKGIGTALLNSLLEWAGQNTVVEKVALGVFAENQAAITLYEKAGFIEEGRRIREIKISEDNYADLVRMYKLVKK
ncbi:MAG: GNAT family N-acetyltransferase [Planctomycetota bacterium]|jgi:RimJ/RimL family protein N-acetyltransferase